jgi:hypothetical protein
MLFKLLFVQTSTAASAAVFIRTEQNAACTASVPVQGTYEMKSVMCRYHEGCETLASETTRL